MRVEVAGSRNNKQSRTLILFLYRLLSIDNHKLSWSSTRCQRSWTCVLRLWSRLVSLWLPLIVSFQSAREARLVCCDYIDTSNNASIENSVAFGFVPANGGWHEILYNTWMNETYIESFSVRCLLVHEHSTSQNTCRLHFSY